MTKSNEKSLLIGITVILMASLSPLVGQERGGQETTKDPLQDRAGGPHLSSSGEKDRPVLQSRNPRYRVQRGDTLELTFPLVPTLNKTVPVQPDGYITLQLVGDLRVEGKTIPELDQLLREEYGKILQKPVFTIELKDFEKPYFIASGEVERPGKYELRGDATVAQAVAVAGGFKEEAKHSQVLLFRRVSDEWVEVKQLNMKKMLQEANLREDLHLQPGDMVFVPKSTISKIKGYLPRASLGFYLNPY
jgi:polysaccharide biosynthesis/export protein